MIYISGTVEFDFSFKIKKKFIAKLNLNKNIIKSKEVIHFIE